MNNELETASEWKLIWKRFIKHKLALFGLTTLIIFYILSIFADFFAPYNPSIFFDKFIYSKPSNIYFIDENNNFSIIPFVYGTKKIVDMKTFKRIYVEDKSKKYPLKFFVKGHEYNFLGIKMSTHLFGVENSNLFIFGTDSLGRDVFSRTIHGARISLTIGLIGVFLAFIFGIILGGISGYYGGFIDNIIQRIIEFLIAIPTLPLWLSLSAILPRNWTMIETYFGITIILSLFSWTGLARVVRGKFISLRSEAFVTAAKLCGASEFRIIFRHMLPNFFSYLIVNMTISIPYMILGETSLSFLGLGLRDPAISWGVILNAAQYVRSVALYPGRLYPAGFVIIVILAFNFVGDGLRDASDPYKSI